MNNKPTPISIIVTTYKTDTLYTQACLESIKKWKMPHHEVIVVVHDETALLRAYLDYCNEIGLVDNLIYTVSGHGHTKSFNIGVENAKHDIIFNICNDIMVGPSLVDDCAHKLLNEQSIGLIGWHWYNNGTRWSNDGDINQYMLRDEANPLMKKDEQTAIERSKWYTGKTFKALGGPKWLCLCNTAFFGVRRDVLELVGGGFGKEFSHYWADDFLNYAILDQGYDIVSFEDKFKDPKYFHEFQYDNIDVEDRRRHDDSIIYDDEFLKSTDLLGGGMSNNEIKYLHLLASVVNDGASVTNVGTWRGSSVIALLDALKHKKIEFNFIDCFDIPEISAFSAQPPVSEAEFLKYIQPYISSGHTVNIIKANTLDMSEFPYSDFFFLDAGHTKECIENDIQLAKKSLAQDGVIAFHDYGRDSWPDVKVAIDSSFGIIDNHETVAVHRNTILEREEYTWKN